MAFSPESVHDLLTPQSIAVVGASESSVWATSIVGNLRQFGFPGTVHMVNPRRDQVFGQPSAPTIADIGEKVDHALVLTPAAVLPKILEDCRDSGVRGVTVVASGFQEAGEEGGSAEGLVDSCPLPARGVRTE